MKKLRSEQRGAVAVEFALLLPILIALLVGIMEFGLAFGAQVTVTNAAREAARAMVIHNSPADARAAALAAAPDLNPALQSSEITFSPASCTPGATSTTTIRYPMQFITGLFGAEIVLTGKATMRCGG